MTRKTVLTTLLALAAIGVMVRLGFWQLDRLQQRRAFNAEVSSRLQAPALTATDVVNLENPDGVKYRAVVLQGEYDLTQQVALANQEWQGLPGVHLITPLVINGGERAVLVDRGWIPWAESAPANWWQFSESGAVEVRGRILSAQAPLALARLVPGTAPSTTGREVRDNAQDTWFRIDIAALQRQVSHPLLPFYIEQAPDPARTDLPYRSEPTLDLSEGPHMGYAITWFALAAILGFTCVGYALSSRGLPLRRFKLTRDGLASQNGRVARRRLARSVRVTARGEPYVRVK